ncbi:hypothetical protein WG66_007425 [Moniliophthora roreri]|uniref:DUF6535 domain-containing protein n=1 Tax=Moniliophthora roreri TaxID=221103 RepID=A0A0W0FI34_MONRR|nr:hypothetical protein WG66_007425 [Moniliophthora roreri]
MPYPPTTISLGILYGPGTPTPNWNHAPSTYAAEIPLPSSPTNSIPSQTYRSWKKLMKEVNRYDDNMVKNQKDDIDTLLVYTDLFFTSSGYRNRYPIADRLWTHADPIIRRRSVFLLLVYAKLWKSYSTTKEDEDAFGPQFDERPVLILALARHLTRADYVSELLVSEEGQRFIMFIHDGITRCQLYQPRDWWDTVKMRKMLVLEWNHAIERAAQEFGQ